MKTVMLYVPFLSASLFIGILFVYAVMDPGSKGFYLKIGNFSPPAECGDDHPLVIGLLPGHPLMLNGRKLAREELMGRLQVALQKRAERVVYVIADREASMQQFVDVVEIANGAAKDVHVVLVTPGNQDYMCLGPNPYDSLRTTD